MKITKTKLKEIIKEELGEESPVATKLAPHDPTNIPAKVEALRRVYNLIDALPSPPYEGMIGQDVTNVWVPDLLSILEDRIMAVEGGRLGQPPPRTVAAIGATMKKVYGGVKRFFSSVADALSYIGLNEAEQLTDKNDKNFARAKRALLKSLRDIRGIARSGSSAWSTYYDIENAEEVEDILILKRDWIRAARGPQQQRAIQVAFDNFKRDLEGDVEDEAAEAAILGTRGKIQRAINILRSPILEDVYLKDIQKALAHIHNAYRTPEQLRYQLEEGKKMKITKTQLKQIIKEELLRVIGEATYKTAAAAARQDTRADAHAEAGEAAIQLRDALIQKLEDGGDETNWVVDEVDGILPASYTMETLRKTYNEILGEMLGTSLKEYGL